MEYRRLGSTGLKVSNICLGTMQFGWSTDEATAHDIMTKAVRLGCNFFDTADFYSRWSENSYAGRSEEIIGNWLQSGVAARDQVIIATKVRGPMGEGPNDQGLSRHHILTEVENSLDRLQTDYIDLYQAHFPDEETPLAETLRAMTDLVRSGMVRYVGCSNYPAWLLMKSLWVSDVNDLVRFDSLQPHYNYVHRAEFERELRAVCLDQGVGVIPYSPLARGFLTGKYRRGEPLPDSVRAGGIQKRYFNDRGFSAVETLAEVANTHDATIAQTAIAWILANPAVTSAIIGANSVTQLTDTAKGAEIQLGDEEKAAMDEVTAWT